MPTKILITLPVYNEEKILEKNVLKLLDYCRKTISNNFEIVISDNASTDTTPRIAQKLIQLYPEIKYYRLEQKGKGLAIKTVWQNFPADFYVFIDADLSTDINALHDLIKILKNNEADLVLGSRYLKNSKIKRSITRSLISFIYNLIIKILFGCSIHDMANGFKGANKKIIQTIVPLIKNEKWFFDSELTLLSHLYGYKIKEIPVSWQEFQERKSRVNILNTSLEYLKELIKLKIKSIGLPEKDYSSEKRQ